MRTSIAAIFAALVLSAQAIAGPVADAARNGDVAGLERLLADGSDANESDAMVPPLHFAAMNGHADAVALLAGHGAELNAASSLGTPLHAAVQFGRVDAVQALLAAGADPETRDADGYTPLLRAATRPSVAVVEALIAGGANVDAVTIGKGNRGEIQGPIIALHEARLEGLDEVVAALQAGGAGPIIPEVPADLLSRGDPVRGREIAVTECKLCHTISADDPPNGPHPYYGAVVPTLVGIIGRDVASLPEFEYSAALIEFGGVWTPERLYEFALTPMLSVPGTRMDWSPDRTPDMVADIVAYLLSEAE